MTGMPTIEYLTKSHSSTDIWNILEEGMKNDYPMVASTMTHPAYDTTPSHAETLLGVVRLSNGARLVKMRNPWGSYKYTGPYSKNSREWTS